MPVRIVSQNGGVVISVKVVPGSSRDRIVGEHGAELKIAVSKTAQDGAANEAVMALLARELGVARKQVSIARGHANPHKKIAIHGVTVAVIIERLGLADEVR